MNTQSTSTQSWNGPIDHQEVVNQIKVLLFEAYHNQFSTETIWTEILRNVIWSLMTQKQPLPLSTSAIPTRSILISARAMWTPFHEERNDDNDESQLDLERHMLDALETQGDIFSLAGGQWLPAPLRLIPLTNAQYLLVGGLPTRLLPVAVRKEIRFHGSFRHIEQGIISQTATLPSYIGSWQIQSREHWLGSPPPTFEQLIQVFRNLTLQQAANQSNGDFSLEVYTPYIAKPQALRWLPVTHVRDGRYLLRTHTSWGASHYSIGEIQGHALISQGELPFSTDTRRLCYALDAEAHTPTYALWDRQHGRLILKSEVPRRERKLLASIATLKPAEDSYYPRTWIGIAPAQRDIVDTLLAQLHIKVTN